MVTRLEHPISAADFHDIVANSKPVVFPSPSTLDSTNFSASSSTSHEGPSPSSSCSSPSSNGDPVVPAPSVSSIGRTPQQQAGTWDLEFLRCHLKDTRVKNVFVSADGRFLYFSARFADDEKLRTKFRRVCMPFSEFVRRGTSSESGTAPEPLLSASEKYYLYGEPMPDCLKDSCPVPDFLEDYLQSSRKSQSSASSQPSQAQREESHSKEDEQTRTSSSSHDITSTLLWVALTGNCSPMHYDLSEGIIRQMNGTKRFVLAPPKHFAALYPYPVASPHDRQSRVDDIRSVNLERFPEFANVELIEGEVRAGEILYIPYGWWHQIESSGLSVSVTHRWGPQKEALERAVTIKSLTGPLLKVPKFRSDALSEYAESLPKALHESAQIALTERFKQMVDEA